MAKYTVTYTCGHEGVVNLMGKSEDRDRKLAYLQTELCPACQKAEAFASHEEANTQAADYSRENNLPELTGSVKQVAWAHTIRKSMIESVEGAVNPSKLMGDALYYVNMYRKQKQLSAVTDRAWLEKKYEEGKAAFQTHLKTETSAKYFIDARNRLEKEFAKYLIVSFYEVPFSDAENIVNHFF